jgi:hypothetical protein
VQSILILELLATSGKERGMRRQSKAHWRWKKRAAGPAWVTSRFPSLPEVGASATVAGGWRDMAGNQSSFIAGGEHSCGGRTSKLRSKSCPTSYLNVVLVCLVRV